MNNGRFTLELIKYLLFLNPDTKISHNKLYRIAFDLDVLYLKDNNKLLFPYYIGNIYINTNNGIIRKSIDRNFKDLDLSFKINPDPSSLYRVKHILEHYEEFILSSYRFYNYDTDNTPYKSQTYKNIIDNHSWYDGLKEDSNKIKNLNLNEILGYF